MATDASTDPALDAAIRAIPSWEGKSLEIVPIAEGRTNRNFRVTAGDETFFLRLSEKSTELLGIDRTAEQDSVRAAVARRVQDDRIGGAKSGQRDFNGPGHEPATVRRDPVQSTAGLAVCDG